MSKYQLIWSQLSNWTNKDVRDYFKTGILGVDSQDPSKYFNETIFKRMELIYESITKIFPFITQKYQISNMQGLLKSIQEAVDGFSLDRQLYSLEKNDWIIVCLVILKCLSFRDKKLEKDLEIIITKELLSSFGLTKEQFALFVDVFVAG